MTEHRKYSIAICKGAALLDETRTLLEYWRPDESIDEFAKQVQQNGILGNATAYRTRDIVRRVFVPRYLRPNDQAAQILKAVITSKLPHTVFRELVLFFSARNDRMLYDLVMREYWPALHRGRLSINVDSVLSFFSEAAVDGRIEKPWSEQVSKKVARGLLGFLRDVGFLWEISRGRMELRDYRISDEGLVIIARLLHDSGLHNASICRHPDWQLFDLNDSAVLGRIHLLGEDFGLLLQHAGSVVSIHWKEMSITELIALLARHGSTASAWRDSKWA